jgi:hypothetical protein
MNFILKNGFWREKLCRAEQDPLPLTKHTVVQGDDGDQDQSKEEDERRLGGGPTVDGPVPKEDVV